MRYTLVFDALNSKAATWPVVFPLVFVILACVGFARPAGFRGSPSAVRRMSAFIALASLAMAIFTWRTLVDDHARVLVALQTGRFTVVEGRVEHFQPGRAGCRDKESFDVAGHHFVYGGCFLSDPFRMTAGEGGPMREGLQVRIAEVDGHIARLEIAR